MYYGVVIKTKLGKIIVSEMKKNILERIPNLNFNQCNIDLTLYDLAIISISNLKHCNEMKKILDDILCPPFSAVVLKETMLVHLPEEKEFEYDKCEIIMMKPNIKPEATFKLLNKVLGCNREDFNELYNRAVFDGEVSLGKFHMEIAEFKINELNKINKFDKPKSIKFKLNRNI